MRNLTAAARLLLSLLILIVFAGCLPPALPTKAPEPGPVLDGPSATLTAFAAGFAATQNAVTGPVASLPSPIATPNLSATPPVGPTVTPLIVRQPADFWMVYVDKRNLAALAGRRNQPSLLTNTQASDYRPSWSDDGSRLAFIRLKPENMQQGTLMVMEAGSSTQLALDETRAYDTYRWIPGSHRIAAMSGFSGGYALRLLDANGGQPLLVAENVAEAAIPSPDGKSLALLINTGAPCAGMGCMQENDLYRYDLDSQSLTQLTRDAKPKMSLAWSPDSQRIAYRAAEGDISAVFQVQAGGDAAGSPVASGEPAPWWSDPWVKSPDGQWIASLVSSPPTNDIYVRPASGGEARLVTRQSQDSKGNAASVDTLRWRPDSLGLVFNLWVEVYTINLDGSELRMLPVTLENVFFDVRPALSAYSPPAAPTAPASLKICSSAPPTRLSIGQQATVATQPPLPNNVRIAPDQNSSLVGKIEPGEQVEVLDGPLCSNNRVWWQVRSLRTELTGWTAEGDNQDYWLVPVPQ